MNQIQKKRNIYKWLLTHNEHGQSLYNFLDELCDMIYRDLQKSGIEIIIPYREFKKKIALYLFDNS
jgi:hypothetical protein